MEPSLQQAIMLFLWLFQCFSSDSVTKQSQQGQTEEAEHMQGRLSKTSQSRDQKNPR